LATIIAGVPLIKVFMDTGFGAGAAGVGFIAVNALTGSNDIAIGSSVIGGLVLLRWIVVTFVLSSTR